MHRLNALLLVPNPCQGDTCRNPWPVLQPNSSASNSVMIQGLSAEAMTTMTTLSYYETPTYASNSSSPINSLADAMDAQYDTLLASLPLADFGHCMVIQSIANKHPYRPAEAAKGLGMEWRTPTDHLTDEAPKAGTHMPIDPNGKSGTWKQRNDTLEDVIRKARNLMQCELPHKAGSIGC